MKCFARILAIFALGQVQASEALFEVRLHRYTQVFQAGLSHEIALPTTKLKGSLSDPLFKLSLAEWGFENNAWILKGLKLTLKSPRWLYDEASVLRVECRNLLAEWDLGRIDWSPAQLARLNWSLRTSEGQAVPDRLEFGGEIREVLAETLRPYFTREALAQRLRLSADCPSNAREVLQGILRAWLVNWPAEAPGDFDKLLDAFQERLAALPLKDVGVFAKLPGDLLKGSDGTDRMLKVFPGATAELLRIALVDRVDSPGVQESLSARARELLVSGAPAGKAAELLLPTATLSRLARMAAEQLPARGAISRSAGGTLQIDLGSDVNLQDFLGLLPELQAHSGRVTKLRPRVVFEDCASRPAAPRLLPYVTPAGANGVDLEWQASLEFVDLQSGAPLAKRHLEKFLLSSVLTRSGAALVPRFAGGRVLPGSAGSGCSVVPFPAEFLLTVDWLFQSEGIKKTINDAVFANLKYDPSAKLRLRQVGEASAGAAREGGGYYSEALVLGADL